LTDNRIRNAEGPASEIDPAYVERVIAVETVCKRVCILQEEVAAAGGKAVGLYD